MAIPQVGTEPSLCNHRFQKQEVKKIMPKWELSQLAVKAFTVDLSCVRRLDMFGGHIEHLRQNVTHERQTRKKAAIRQTSRASLYQSVFPHLVAQAR